MMDDGGERREEKGAEWTDDIQGGRGIARRRGRHRGEELTSMNYRQGQKRRYSSS